MIVSTRPVADGSVWQGRDLASRSDWIDSFDAKETEALMAALHAVRKRGLQPREVRRSDFAVPALRERFLGISRQLEHGRGFALVRGLPLDGLTDDDCKLLFWGMGMQLGMPVCQNKRHDFITEVKDVGEVMGRATTRAYRAAGPLRFHTDQCDVLGLMCIRGAASGGHSRIASATAIYNEILARRPDFLALLSQPYYFSQQGEEAPGEKPWYVRPIFDPNGGRFTSLFTRSYIESAQKLEGVPPLSEAQDEASHYVAKVAEELSFTMELRRGDIQLFNCHVTYHSRTNYEDHPEPERKRTLARLWLAAPNSRPLPDYVATYWGASGAGELRGGVWHPSGRRHAFKDWQAGGWTAHDLDAWKGAPVPA